MAKKRGPGRPQSTNRRDRVVAVHCTRDEYAAFEAAAWEMRIPMSAWVRAQLVRLAEKRNLTSGADVE